MTGRVRSIAHRALGAAVAVIITLGCGTRDEAARPEAAEDDGFAEMDSMQDDNTPPPPLPQIWSSMTSEDLIEHVATHGYRPRGSSRSTHRKCEDGLASAKCNLLNMPLQGVKELEMTAVGETGVIVSRIENIGTQAEAHLGIPAGAFRYWLLVRENQVLKSYLLDLSGPTPVAGPSYPVVDCDPHNHSRSVAGFKRCKREAKPGAAGAPVTDHFSPPWTTCSLGCCTADIPDGGP